MAKRKEIQVNYPTDDCPNCGRNEATVWTTARQTEEDVFVNDGDRAECNYCSHEGVVVVEDSECADVVYDEMIDFDD